MKKIAFLGTPSYTLPVIEFLHQKGVLKVIVSKYTKQSGRGLKLQDSDLKKFALKHCKLFLSYIYILAPIPKLIHKVQYYL